MAFGKTKNRILRAVSFATLGFFLFNQISFANPGAGIDISVAREVPGSLRIDIPADLASLDDIYEAPPSPDPKLILQIQNAHANYGAQQKIKQLLEYLHKNYAVGTIFVEGAVEPLNPDYLKYFPDRERNLQLADYLARQGELTGADLFVIETDGKAVRAEGIESTELYRANYEALKKVFSNEPLVDRYTGGIESRLQSISSQIAGDDMRRILAEWRKFEKGWRDFLPFVKQLSADAKKTLRIDLNSVFSQVEWPQITRLLVLQQMEKDLKPAAAEKQKAALVKFLKDKELPADLIRQIENFKDQHITLSRSGKGGAAEAVQPRYLLERLARDAGPKGFKFSDHPDFSLYAGYLILKSEIDSKALYAEMNRLFTQVLDSLAATPEQKELLALSRDAELVRKLLRLELTRRDWNEVLRRGEALEMDALVGRLKALGKEISGRLNLKDSDFDSKKLNGKFRDGVAELSAAAREFYDLARRRESVFYEKMSAVMAGRSESKAVLITGGFHTDGVSELLRENEVSYGVLTPRLMEKSDEKLYRANMLQNRERPFSVSYLEIATWLSKLITQEAQGVEVGERVEDLLTFMTVKAGLTLENAIGLVNAALLRQGLKGQFRAVEGNPNAFEWNSDGALEGVPSVTVTMDEKLTVQVGPLGAPASMGPAAGMTPSLGNTIADSAATIAATKPSVAPGKQAAGIAKMFASIALAVFLLVVFALPARAQSLVIDKIGANEVLLLIEGNPLVPVELQESDDLKIWTPRATVPPASSAVVRESTSGIARKFWRLKWTVPEEPAAAPASAPTTQTTEAPSALPPAGTEGQPAPAAEAVPAPEKTTAPAPAPTQPLVPSTEAEWLSWFGAQPGSKGLNPAVSINKETGAVTFVIPGVDATRAEPVTTIFKNPPVGYTGGNPTLSGDAGTTFTVTLTLTRAEVRALIIRTALSREQVIEAIAEFGKKLSFQQELVLPGMPKLGKRPVPYYTSESGESFRVATISVNDAGSFAASRSPESVESLTEFVAGGLESAGDYDVYGYQDWKGDMEIRVLPSAIAAAMATGEALPFEVQNYHDLNRAQAIKVASRLAENQFRYNPWLSSHPAYDRPAIEQAIVTRVTSAKSRDLGELIARNAVKIITSAAVGAALTANAVSHISPVIFANALTPALTVGGLFVFYGGITLLLLLLAPEAFRAIGALLNTAFPGFFPRLPEGMRGEPVSRLVRDAEQYAAVSADVSAGQPNADTAKWNATLNYLRSLRPQQRLDLAAAEQDMELSDELQGIRTLQGIQRFRGLLAVLGLVSGIFGYVLIGSGLIVPVLGIPLASLIAMVFGITAIIASRFPFVAFWGVSEETRQASSGLSSEGRRSLAALKSEVEGLLAEGDPRKADEIAGLLDRAEALNAREVNDDLRRQNWRDLAGYDRRLDELASGQVRPLIQDDRQAGLTSPNPFVSKWNLVTDEPSRSGILGFLRGSSDSAFLNPGAGKPFAEELDFFQDRADRMFPATDPKQLGELFEFLREAVRMRTRSGDDVVRKLDGVVRYDATDLSGTLERMQQAAAQLRDAAFRAEVRAQINWADAAVRGLYYGLGMDRLVAVSSPLKEYRRANGDSLTGLVEAMRLYQDFRREDIRSARVRSWLVTHVVEQAQNQGWFQGVPNNGIEEVSEGITNVLYEIIERIVAEVPEENAHLVSASDIYEDMLEAFGAALSIDNSRPGRAVLTAKPLPPLEKGEALPEELEGMQVVKSISPSRLDQLIRDVVAFTDAAIAAARAGTATKQVRAEVRNAELAALLDPRNEGLSNLQMAQRFAGIWNGLGEKEKSQLTERVTTGPAWDPNKQFDPGAVQSITLASQPEAPAGSMRVSLVVTERHAKGNLVEYPFVLDRVTLALIAARVALQSGAIQAVPPEEAAQAAKKKPLRYQGANYVGDILVTATDPATGRVWMFFAERAPGVYSITGGFRNQNNEDPLIAALREFAEEMGIILRDDKKDMPQQELMRRLDEVGFTEDLRNQIRQIWDGIAEKDPRNEAGADGLLTSGKYVHSTVFHLNIEWDRAQNIAAKFRTKSGELRGSDEGPARFAPLAFDDAEAGSVPDAVKVDAFYANHPDFIRLATGRSAVSTGLARSEVKRGWTEKQMDLFNAALGILTETGLSAIDPNLQKYLNGEVGGVYDAFLDSNRTEGGVLAEPVSDLTVDIHNNYVGSQKGEGFVLYDQAMHDALHRAIQAEMKSRPDGMEHAKSKKEGLLTLALFLNPGKKWQLKLEHFTSPEAQEIFKAALRAQKIPEEKLGQVTVNTLNNDYDQLAELKVEGDEWSQAKRKEFLAGLQATAIKEVLMVLNDTGTVQELVDAMERGDRESAAVAAVKLLAIIKVMHIIKMLQEINLVWRLGNSWDAKAELPFSLREGALGFKDIMLDAYIFLGMFQKLLKGGVSYELVPDVGRSFEKLAEHKDEVIRLFGDQERLHYGMVRLDAQPFIRESALNQRQREALRLTDIVVANEEYRQQTLASKGENQGAVLLGASIAVRGETPPLHKDVYEAFAQAMGFQGWREAYVQAGIEPVDMAPDQDPGDVTNARSPEFLAKLIVANKKMVFLMPTTIEGHPYVNKELQLLLDFDNNFDLLYELQKLGISNPQERVRNYLAQHVTIVFGMRAFLNKHAPEALTLPELQEVFSGVRAEVRSGVLSLTQELVDRQGRDRGPVTLKDGVTVPVVLITGFTVVLPGRAEPVNMVLPQASVGFIAPLLSVFFQEGVREVTVHYSDSKELVRGYDGDPAVSKGVWDLARGVLSVPVIGQRADVTLEDGKVLNANTPEGEPDAIVAMSLDLGDGWPAVVLNDGQGLSVLPKLRDLLGKLPGRDPNSPVKVTVYYRPEARAAEPVTITAGDRTITLDPGNYVDTAALERLRETTASGDLAVVQGALSFTVPGEVWTDLLQILRSRENIPDPMRTMPGFGKGPLTGAMFSAMLRERAEARADGLVADLTQREAAAAYAENAVAARNISLEDALAEYNAKWLPPGSGLKLGDVKPVFAQLRVEAGKLVYDGAGAVRVIGFVGGAGTEAPVAPTGVEAEDPFFAEAVYADFPDLEGKASTKVDLVRLYGTRLHERLSAGGWVVDQGDGTFKFSPQVAVLLGQKEPRWGERVSGIRYRVAGGAIVEVQGSMRAAMYQQLMSLDDSLLMLSGILARLEPETFERAEARMTVDQAVEKVERLRAMLPKGPVQAYKRLPNLYADAGKPVASLGVRVTDFDDERAFDILEGTGNSPLAVARRIEVLRRSINEKITNGSRAALSEILRGLSAVEEALRAGARAEVRTAAAVVAKFEEPDLVERARGVAKVLAEVPEADAQMLQGVSFEALRAMGARFSDEQLRAMNGDPRLVVAVALTWGFVSNAERDLDAVAPLLVTIAGLVAPQTLTGLRDALAKASGQTVPVNGEKGYELNVSEGIENVEDAVLEITFDLLADQGMTYQRIVLADAGSVADQEEKVKQVIAGVKAWAERIHKADLAAQIQIDVIEMVPDARVMAKRVETAMAKIGMQNRNYVISGTTGAIDRLMKIDGWAEKAKDRLVFVEEFKQRSVLLGVAARRVTARAARHAYGATGPVSDMIAALLAQQPGDAGFEVGKDNRLLINERTLGTLRTLQALFKAFQAISKAA